MPFPYIFTFYSYKGGVGRSLAVLNVAYTLVSRGRHVLIVDLDLEAPGLSGFLQRNGELEDSSAAHPKDVLSLLEAGIEAVRHGRAPEDLPPVSNFLRPVKSEKLIGLEPKYGKVGRLDVIGADQDRDYLGRMAGLRIKDLSQDQLVGLSRLLHGYFKSQRFSFRPTGVDEPDPPLSTPYDYVLVDSRTGITEIGGLCVGPLADRLVVITGLNDQNVIGTRDFLKEVGIAPQARPENAEPWDDADPVGPQAAEAPSLGPKPTIVVASPVPAGEVLYKRERMKALEAAIGLRPLALPYHPQMALMESIFVRDYREEYLTVEYRRLTTQVMRQVDDEPQQLLQRLANQQEDLPLAIELALRMCVANSELGPVASNILVNRKGAVPHLSRLYATLALDPSTRLQALGNWGNALSEQAKTKAGPEADRLFAEAGQRFSEAHRLKPDHFSVLSNWGAALSEQAKTKAGPEADRLFAEAGQRFSEAHRLKPDHPGVLNNWGASLCEQAKTTTGADSDRFFVEGMKKYRDALQFAPNHVEALSNWGNALSFQAQLKTGEEADRLFAEAAEKYSEALAPRDPQVFYKWGLTLNAQAKMKRDAESGHRYAEAVQMFSEADRLNPKDARILNSWGAALSGLARTRAGTEAEMIHVEAGEKYRTAHQLNPDGAEILSNWATALSEQARAGTGPEADRLFAEAIQKYTNAHRLAPNDARILSNWGNTTSERAKTKTGAEANRLFAEAGQKYSEANRLAPTDASILTNWGLMLSLQARTRISPDDYQLFDEAAEKYHAAHRLKPDDVDVLNNLGAGLSDQAKNKKRTGAEADRLLAEAAQKLGDAHRLNPERSDVLNNWGAALLNLAQTKLSPAADDLMAEARSKLMKAEQIRPGSASFNLACLESLLGNAAAAVDRLQTASNGERLNRARLLNESDFDPIRQNPLFDAFLKSLPD